MREGKIYLYVTKLLLYPKDVTVRWDKLALYELEFVPSRMDIAGDHIVFVERGVDLPVSGQEMGKMSIFNWKSLTFAQCPEVS
jgi:hypothetical protein